MVRWLPYFIAGRYLRSRKSHSVINIISGVSVAAMATPVAAMVILLSVFNGLEGMVRTLYRAVDADITIRAAEGTVFDAAAVDTAAIRAGEGGGAGWGGEGGRGGGGARSRGVGR